MGSIPSGKIDITNKFIKGMIKVIRKRDILKARILTLKERSEINRSGPIPDVIATDPSGRVRMLTREELRLRYTYLNGAKISIAGLKAGREFFITRPDNSEALAIMIPLNCTARVNGRFANPPNRKKADYIVADVDNNGNIINESIGIISYAMFKKMYYIPPNEVITRNRLGKHKVYMPGVRKHYHKTNSSKQSDTDTQKNGFDFGDKDMYSNMHGANVEIHSEGVKRKHGVQSTSNKSKYDTIQKGVISGGINTGKSNNKNAVYIATGRLVDAMGNHVGFIIQTKNGKSIKVTKKQMMDMCSQKLISNISLCYHIDTGKPYLRGNNIRIENLPSYRV